MLKPLVTSRETNTWTDTHINRQTDSNTDRDRQTDRQTDRPRQAETDRDRKAATDRDRHNDKYSKVYVFLSVSLYAFSYFCAQTYTHT